MTGLPSQKCASSCRNGGMLSRASMGLLRSTRVLLQLLDFGLHGIQLVVRLLLAVLLGLARKRLALSHGNLVIALSLGHNRITGGVRSLLVSLGLCVAHGLVGARIRVRQLVS